MLLGIDGASGVGKSTFADEVAARIRREGHTAIRSTTDSFHRPRAARYQRGPTSPEGYYIDSHDLAALRNNLLGPFIAGARRVQVAAFDEPTDTPVSEYTDVQSEPAVLVFDGLFLLRPELAELWHLTVHLKADRRRDQGWQSYLCSGLPDGEPDRQQEIDRRLASARWPRYSDGWKLYCEHVRPEAMATIVIDNDDLSAPALVK